MGESLSTAAEMDVNTLLQTSTVLLLFANKPAILIMANGKPQHFFKISSDTFLKSGWQSSPEKNSLVKNNLWESSSLSGLASYICAAIPVQHLLATAFLRVVVIILLPLSLTGKADRTRSHADSLQISSIKMKYLHALVTESCYYVRPPWIWAYSGEIKEIGEM